MCSKVTVQHCTRPLVPASAEKEKPVSFKLFDISAVKEVNLNCCKFIISRLESDSNEENSLAVKARKSFSHLPSQTSFRLSQGFFPIREDPFMKGFCCRRKQTGSHRRIPLNT